MHICHVRIRNFRGIASADVSLGPSTLLVGENNVGKTTILEAINLVLGPERSLGQEAINEHDFFAGAYTAPETDQQSEEPNAAPEIRIEVTLDGIQGENLTRFREHLEAWKAADRRPYTAEEVEALPDGRAPEHYVLRVGFRGWYDGENDEFKAKTFYLSSGHGPGEEPSDLGRRDKQKLGFLYLRAYRSATRAATLERGSLLDILLDLQKARPRVWNAVLGNLHSLGDALGQDATFKRALTDLEGRIQKYLPRPFGGQWHNSLFVSNLTRQQLRGVMTYFLRPSTEQHEVPLMRLGNGVTNVLVLALLSAIAEQKENVIFAMEEPETALPPHTQRQILKELSLLSDQMLVTSHSPYVAERFLDETILVLRKDGGGTVTGNTVQGTNAIDPKRVQQDFRLRYAEGLLGRAVLLVEGISDRAALSEANRILSQVKGTAYEDCDLLGVTIIPTFTAGDLAKTAKFYKSLGVRSFAMSDQIDATLKADVESGSEWYRDVPYKGIEALLTTECALGDLEAFLADARKRADFPVHLKEPMVSASEAERRRFALDVLCAKKGELYAGLLVGGLKAENVPVSIMRVLANVGRRARGMGYPLTDILHTWIGSLEPDLFVPAAAPVPQET